MERLIENFLIDACEKEEVHITVNKKFDYLNELSVNVIVGKISNFEITNVQSEIGFDTLKISIFFEDGSVLEETLSSKSCNITNGYDVISDVIVIKDNLKEIHIMWCSSNIQYEFTKTEEKK